MRLRVPDMEQSCAMFKWPKEKGRSAAALLKRSLFLDVRIPGNWDKSITRPVLLDVTDAWIWEVIAEDGHLLGRRHIVNLVPCLDRLRASLSYMMLQSGLRRKNDGMLVTSIWMAAAAPTAAALANRFRRVISRS
jgi:hypothetical protein